MEALGVTSSIIAIIEISAKLGSLCLQYAKGVKNARADINRLLSQVSDLENASTGLLRLLDGPDGANIKLTLTMRNAVENGLARLEKVHKMLCPNGARQTMSRLGIRSMKWPFKSKDMDQIMQDLGHCTQTICLALQIDQTEILLDIDRRVRHPQLPIAENATLNSHAQEHDPLCAPSTRIELLQEIYDWVASPGSKSIYWLNGMAGTGKSTISRTVGKYFQNKGQLGATFFFQRGEANRAGISRFFTTIAFELILRVPSTLPFIRDVLDEDQSITTKNLTEQFDKLFLGPLSHTSVANSPIVIIIDALDECEQEEDIKLVLKLLSRVETELPNKLKVFLTSRPELPLRLGFSAIKGTYKAFVLHEVPELMVEQDINTFLGYELARIRDEYNAATSRNGIDYDWPELKDIRTLAAMAVPLFIFASIACRFIANRKRGDPREQFCKVLDETLKTKGHEAALSEMYLFILCQQLIGLEDEAREQVLEEFRIIVGSIILLATPLPVPVLAQVIDVPDHLIENRLEHLHSVLYIPNSPDTPIRPLHGSFRDFLVSPTAKGLHRFQINEPKGHVKLVCSCLRTLACLKQDICGIKAPGTLRTAVDPGKIKASLTPEVQYACQYWVYHLEKAQILIEDGAQVYEFLTRQFLYWVEALSLIGLARHIPSLIETLQLRLDPDRSSELSGFLDDALRFLWANVSIIDLAPLQLYSSLLVFAPKSSQLKTKFQHEGTWVTCKTGGEEKWSSCIQVFEAHEDCVNSVAFSHDSALLVSAANDGTILLWHYGSGEYIRSFEGHHGPVLSVNFSHSSKLIASGGGIEHEGGELRLWCTRTGEHIRAFEGHLDAVYSVNFSNDSSLIASASDIIRLWRTDSGQCIQTFGDNSGYTSVSLSNNAALVAGVSSKDTLHLWRIETGEGMQLFPEAELSCAAFSSDSAILASASSGAIQLWCTDNGHHIRTMSQHEDPFYYTLAFSHDSTMVASVSGDNIYLWHADTGECIQVLKGHITYIAQIVFSPNSALLASASWDGTVRLWHMYAGEHSQSPSHADKTIVQLVAIAPDSKFVAAALHDLTIRVWRTSTGQCVHILRGHTSSISAIAFSHDSSLLATSSADRSVRICSTSTGACIHSWTGYSSAVESMAFSHDSELIALGSKDHSLRVWSISNGECTQVLSGHHGSVSAVAFSNYNSALVASASLDGTVRTWRRESGECTRIIRLETPTRNLKFESFSQRLLAGTGATRISRDSLAIAEEQELVQARNCGLGIAGDECWVTWNGGNLFWLPVEARPARQCTAVSGNIVVIGANSGEVIILEFSPNLLEESYMATARPLGWTAHTVNESERLMAETAY